jgi:hypothetical protein
MNEINQYIQMKKLNSHTSNLFIQIRKNDRNRYWKELHWQLLKPAELKADLAKQRELASTEKPLEAS